MDHVIASHRRRSRGGLDQRAQHVDRGGLAGAVWAEEAEYLPGGDVELDTAHRMDVAEALVELTDRDRASVATSVTVGGGGHPLPQHYAVSHRPPRRGSGRSPAVPRRAPSPRARSADPSPHGPPAWPRCGSA